MQRSSGAFCHALHAVEMGEASLLRHALGAAPRWRRGSGGDAMLLLSAQITCSDQEGRGQLMEARS